VGKQHFGAGASLRVIKGIPCSTRTLYGRKRRRRSEGGGDIKERKVGDYVREEEKERRGLFGEEKSK
jgi:hypothetical protein